MSYTNLKLFALSSNQELAAKVADKMGIELGKSSVREFSDGEIQVNIEESIRGHHVFILQSTSSPVNDNLMEILIMVDALKRASAETISVVMPYYGYARQDTSEVMNIIGNVEGKTCILIDDMIDTAGTICHAADALAEAGATHVYASCTHPVLSGPALDNIQKSAIEKLVVLDTIYLPEERLIDKIEQISIADLISEAIIRIHEKRPLSPLFEMGHK